MNLVMHAVVHMCHMLLNHAKVCKKVSTLKVEMIDKKKALELKLI
jgi:hypothetical protein